MEYCGGGSISDICQVLEGGLQEDHIAVIMREALKVRFVVDVVVISVLTRDSPLRD